MINREPSHRKIDQVRPIEIITGVNRYAEGSALIKMGHTHVLCTASLTPGVPDWLKGQGKGWVTGEYSMLPRSTHTRIKREKGTHSGRSQEIQRLIGRALRAMVDLNKLGENTLILDCDVLQADGGTRTAAINGGCVALGLALQHGLKKKLFSSDPFIDCVGAMSLGILKNEVLVDLDYQEDTAVDVDMNFVMTGSGEWIEIQGTAEKQGFSQSDLTRMSEAAQKAIQQVLKLQQTLLKIK